MKKLPVFTSGLIAGLLISLSTVTLAASTDLVAKIFERKIVVNGVELKLDNKPLLINNRTYLPVRDLVEGLGHQIVGVDSKQISIQTDGNTPNKSNTPVKNEAGVQGEFVENLYSLITTENKIDVDKIKKAVNDGVFNINVQDQETGYSLYHYAVLDNSIPLYSYLKSEKANAELQDNTGKTPLHWTVIEKNNLFISFLTSEIGVKTKIADNDGKFPIDYAEKNSTFERRLKNYKE